MRTKEQVVNGWVEDLKRTGDHAAMGSITLSYIFEAVMDIRELLAYPPIEVSGQPMSDTDYRNLFNSPEEKP